MAYMITEDCTKCGACVEACPVDAVEDSQPELMEIDQDKCTECGACMTACPVQAVSMLQG